MVVNVDDDGGFEDFIAVEAGVVPAVAVVVVDTAEGRKPVPLEVVPPLLEQRLSRSSLRSRLAGRCCCCW